MIAALHLPATLAGQPLAACGMPPELAALLSLHNMTCADVIGTCWSQSGTVHVTLQNEFEDALGYHFDWGWVIPAMPRWYVDDDGKAGPPVWRFVPTAVWQELAQAGRLAAPVHDIIGQASKPVRYGISQVMRAPLRLHGTDPSFSADMHYEELERALPHDLCTLWPYCAEDADPAVLVQWLERAFLPRAMLALLRLLKSAALARIHEIEKQQLGNASKGGRP
ncbi:hypothetical protein [Noviherbaspirillum saxi]|uniref:Uncharacterized protein n=1 Tax=Noviherbaspirillum saxi TaxID=2320863 RepID=A0A3A3FXM1_9BURK|nr:hypothetical protein [Noviherbaspirillum saxi]RJF99428.1 hypothetical protein D3871_13520 [Noviherbaspirillum saxi]